MKKKLFFAVAALTFSAGLPPAQAAIVEVTYTGTVADGTIDTGGIFGTAGASIGGDSYQVVYKFNTAPSLGQSYSPGPPTADLYGGVLWGGTSPSLGAVVTINGQTVSLLGSYAGEIQSYTSGGFRQFYSYAADNPGSYTQNWIASTSSGLPFASITTPFTYSAGIGDGSYSYTQIGADVISSNLSTVTLSVEGAQSAPGPTPGVGLLSMAFLVLAGLATRARGFLAR